MDNTTDCPNCSGLGTIQAFAHIDNGVCYSCKGSGRVKASTTTEGAKGTRMAALRTSELILGDKRQGYEVQAKRWTEKLARDLFAMGSANARLVLAEIANGRWDDNERSGLDPVRGRELVRELCRVGREMDR